MIEPIVSTEPDQKPLAQTPPKPSPSRTGARLASASLFAGFTLLTACALPPKVELEEAYEDGPSSATFDHSALDSVLTAHVDAGGWVDYAGLEEDDSALDTYLTAIGAADFDALGRDEKLAFLINAYNAATLRLMLDHWPVDSIRDIPSSERWDGRTFRVAGRDLSLNQIEHEEIRPNFKEPRIHFAVNCASVGCPPLLNEAYTAEALEEQLTAQTALVHSDPRWFTWNPGSDTVGLTKLYDWYGDDFVQTAGSPIQYVAQQVPALAERLANGDPPKTTWIEYDWTSNDIANRP